MLLLLLLPLLLLPALAHDAARDDAKDALDGVRPISDTLGCVSCACCERAARRLRLKPAFADRFQCLGRALGIKIMMANSFTLLKKTGLF